MSANIGRIVAEITANTAGLRRGAADAQRILSDTSSGASAAGKAIGVAFAVTAALGVVKLIDKLEDCTQVAIDNKKALMGLESVAKAYGVSADEAKKATQSFTQDGLLQMKSATIGMKNIISTGFNITEAMNLSKALKDIGAFNNVTGDIGQAFEDATKGMRTGSIELIENIGLTQKLSAVMKAAGVDISNGIDLTNNAAQREAFYNMVLKEGEKFKGNAAKLANDQASSQEKANAAMQEAADAIGNRLLPAYSELMGIITNVSKKTADIFKESEISKATTAIVNQKMELYTLSEMYLTLKSKVNKSTVEQEMYLQTINDLKTAYPEYLGNLDLQNIKLEKAQKIMKQLNGEMERKFIIQLGDAKVKDFAEDIADEAEKERYAIYEVARLKAKYETERGQTGKNPSLQLYEAEWNKWQKKAEAAAEKQKEYLEKIKKTRQEYNEIAEKTFPQLKISEEPEGIYNNYDSSKEPDTTTTKEDLGKKERFSLDTSESTKQKLIEQEYKYKVDLANAKEEEKWRVELENRKAIAIINATAENEKKIAKIREKVESGKLSESAGKKQAQALNEALAEQLGVFELSEATAKSKAEKAYEKFGKALGLLDINDYIKSENLELEVIIKPVFTQENKKYSARDKLFIYGEGHFNPAVGLTDSSESKTTFAQQGTGGDAKKESEYVNKSLEDVTKSFADLASVLDNDVLNALSNVASQAVSMKNNISGFSAAQGASDPLGMLVGGIGMFSSAVSIMQVVGGMFSDSTYNFDEAVKKMLKGIGEKTPEVQIAEYQKAVDYRTVSLILTASYGKNGREEAMKKITELGLQDAFEVVWNNSKYANEMIANLEKIIPQLAEQLGTAAGDFGSAIGSALSSATTSEELKANLYDSIYGTVKSGLINAFLAGELMKPLLENLQQTVTIAVADGTLDAAEKTAIQGLLGNVNTEADKFYDALEEVGLNVVDAAGQLNEAADRMDNVNRNLRLADRISTITTQTAYGVPPALGGNSSIVYDFSNANLGGMTEQQVISAVSKANRMASIRKVGV